MPGQHEWERRPHIPLRQADRDHGVPTLGVLAHAGNRSGYGHILQLSLRHNDYADRRGQLRSRESRREVACGDSDGDRELSKPRRVRLQGLGNQRQHAAPTARASLDNASEVATPLELRAAFSPVHTDRLLLRAVSESDADASFAIHGDPATYRFHPNGVTRSREQSAAQLVRWQREWSELGFGFWAVRLAVDERVVGFGGLTRRTFHKRPVLNAYYRFAPRVWGHGYATEMTRAALRLAERLLPELPVLVRTRPANLAARGVAENLGLKRAPELDDHMLTYVSHWTRAAPASLGV